jgi:hypothetical protein
MQPALSVKTQNSSPTRTRRGLLFKRQRIVSMESYHTTESGAIGADTETPAVQAIIDRIDSLRGERAQCVAAAIQLLLTTFIKAERRHELALTPKELTILQIAGTAGYPKAAVWRSLPIIAAAGLLTWRKLNADQVEVTWLMSDSEAAQC